MFNKFFWAQQNLGGNKKLRWALSSGLTDGVQGGEPPPWQAKYKNWATFSWHFDI